MRGKAAGLVTNELTTLKVLATAGVIRPYPPQVLVGIVRTLRRWGRGPAGGFATLALRAPDQVGLVDERGELTFGELERRSNALARGLRDLGVEEGGSVAVLCRNHRGFVEATIAVAKLGADLLYLNTAFAAPQLGEVCEREEPAVVIYDEEFDGLIEEAGVRATRVLAWQESDTDRPTLDALVAACSSEELTHDRKPEAAPGSGHRRCRQPPGRVARRRRRGNAVHPRPRRGDGPAGGAGRLRPRGDP